MVEGTLKNKLGWFWNWQELSAGPYQSLQELLADLGLENETPKTLRPYGYKIERRYDKPRLLRRGT
jgi:hypothetical protein